MKFLVPNYSCLQNPWLGGYHPQIPIISVLCPQLNLLNPPRKKFLGTPLPIDNLELRVTNACKSTILIQSIPWQAIICLPLIAEFRALTQRVRMRFVENNSRAMGQCFVWDMQVILFPTDDIFHVCLGPWVIYCHNRPLLKASYNFCLVVYYRPISVGLLQEE
jgi:hypothetical protein